ncbi:flavin-dependent oxidoreductase [Actinomadura sp. DC4]|uniref:flavin-dependent oxidoreductase n=1 Tax=Actinomadura sp. DC4 TaxID=3055069 RepID=UPI0025AFA956|nr:flavin-dependent oxidoreductase [Actinomadura sp. DC4]MDN3355192.1 flavin-dependent oxidoreductase [Actinomadura sp. DC4]
MTAVKVLVVGAGVGGLTTALSLHAAGAEVVVVDAARTLLPLGVGINLQPHAVRELTELGLGDALEATGVQTREMLRLDRHANHIIGHDRGLFAGYSWPQYSIHRGELQMLLLDAVVERLGPEAVRTGLIFESYAEDEEGVEVALHARTGGAPVRMRADVLVGADGISSAVRRQLHPGEGAPLWNGIRMWRGIAETDPFLTGRSMIVAGSHAHGRLVFYPISKTAESRSRALVNWVAEVRVTPETRLETETADWTREGRLEDVLPYYADWDFGWMDVPRLIADSPQILEYPMVDRDPLPYWSRGRVTLVGDAAHPMYPIGANGGSLAIIDARVLAWELSRTDDPVDALKAYEAARLDEANAVVLACRDMAADRLLDTVAERAPDGFAAISDVLTAAELTDMNDAWRRTTDMDTESLNSRPSWTPRR